MCFSTESPKLSIELMPIVQELLAEYDVDEATAKQAVANFVAKLSDNGFLA